MPLIESEDVPSNQHASSNETKPSSESHRAWYADNVTTIPSEARELLEQYSKIPPEEVIPHVLNLVSLIYRLLPLSICAISLTPLSMHQPPSVDNRLLPQRDKAFAVDTYACIGQLRFLNASLPSQPSYPAILSLLRSGATYLDAGCCFAQELRYLAHAGIPSDQLYGFDLEPRFYECGYELFRDRETLQATFVSGDVLAKPNSGESGGLDTLVGQMDVVFANSFLHVWDWEDMIEATKRLVSFTKPKKGSIVLGRQLGSVNACSHQMPTKGGSNWRHNAESMERFWRQVGKETGSEWKVEAALDDGAELKGNKGHNWSEPEMRMISWSAVRL